MLLRHPHAVPSNALQREDGRREKESERAEGRAILLQSREGRHGGYAAPIGAEGPGDVAHRPPAAAQQLEERGHVPRSRESHPKASFCLLHSRFRVLAGREQGERARIKVRGGVPQNAGNAPMPSQLEARTYHHQVWEQLWPQRHQ